MSNDRVEISPDARLRNCPEKQLSCWVPSPLAERLQALVDEANDAGAGASNKELVSALILSAPEDGVRLRDLVTTYRTASAADAAPRGKRAADILVFRRRERGPRKRPRCP